MLVVMHKNASPDEVAKVCALIKEMGLTAHSIPGALRVAIGITGNKEMVDTNRIASMNGVLDIIHVTQPYKLTNREMKAEDTVVSIKEARFGGGNLTVIAGPCAVENEEPYMDVARSVKKYGASMLRGGAFKPRTSPYTFQGLGEEGLKIMAKARAETGLPIVSEAVDTDTFDIVEEYVDMIQIGARNMQNYSLLRRAGRSKKPVLLKRGMSSTIKEFLLAAEYIMSEGNYHIVLCERGIRTFSDYTRFTLDISSIPELKKLTHLPVIADPSHASGKRDMVIPLSRASIAAGADGLIVEVHTDPEQALSDGAQSLTVPMFERMMQEITFITQTIKEHNGKIDKGGDR
ncbi:3-deoxy-7-phosphoheptulonate synthase [candidate division WOR-3 bacterium RBG_13_43_14]|uniref:3-deoxy-7-phosphoheptulonate synthase n=1 Tax=candidate division WOR-3 bacterium RBG_13_43_14 TaxID=1802590 RepID=A0A1F4U2E3_UNCW3|nr:MAG: 3-deoxy-7-phosphoheptulonate synthase [candidate division WOR-3 bacterium RBG_13_43_14]